jgi:hypothetical protein
MDRPSDERTLYEPARESPVHFVPREREIFSTAEKVLSNRNAPSCSARGNPDGSSSGGISVF